MLELPSRMSKDSEFARKPAIKANQLPLAAFRFGEGLFLGAL